MGEKQESEGGGGEVKPKEVNADDIAKSVREQVSTDFQKFTQDFTKDITEKVADAVKTSTEEDGELEDDDDGELLTKADLKDTLKKFGDDMDKKIKKGAGELLTEVSNKNSKDAEAFKTFPMMSRESKHYNEEFEAAVSQELERREKLGRDPKDPELIYDSAAAVFASNSKWQRKTDDDIEEDYRRGENRHSSFLPSNNSSRDGNYVSKGQSEFAKRMGIDPKRSKELRKKYGYGN